MTTHKVVVVGAGFGGLTMAAELKHAGISEFLVLEEGPEVGGVWRENTYPGCSCEVARAPVQLRPRPLPRRPAPAQLSPRLLEGRTIGAPSPLL